MPALFVALSKAPGVHKVVVVSSRTNDASVLRTTQLELQGYGVRYAQLHLIEDAGLAKELCPHRELDWYQKYLWQKVAICLRERVDAVFEDDLKVIELFKRYAPRIQILQVHSRISMIDGSPD